MTSKKTFDEWKIEVSRAMVAKTGMHPDDLPDWDYWVAWDSGTSPRQAVIEAIRSAKEY